MKKKTDNKENPYKIFAKNTGIYVKDLTRVPSPRKGSSNWQSKSGTFPFFIFACT